MTEADFSCARRQKFLTEKYFILNNKSIDSMLDAAEQGIRDRKNSEIFDRSAEGGIFKLSLQKLVFHYTAERAIESLIPMYSDVVRAFEAWHDIERAYLVGLAAESQEKLDVDRSPIDFEELYHFQLVISVVSIGLLLGQKKSVLKVVQLLNWHRGSDMMFESLVEFVVPDPRDVEEFFFDQPYRPLLEAVYDSESNEESERHVKEYLTNWYKSFKGVPWHDGHLIVTDEYSAYEGYWAFEAAAICVTRGIDDSTFRDHLVYPKDLADWARSQVVTDGSAPSGGRDGLSGCVAGDACAKAGFWFTPAGGGHRRAFESGEIMPAVPGDYGVTVWQWDASQ